MSSCQLCEAEAELSTVQVSDAPQATPSEISICAVCQEGMSATELEPNHWRPLVTTMWSESSAVKVMAYRLLSRLSGEASGQAWAQDALDMIYLTDEERAWGDAGIAAQPSEPTRDSNGTILSAGDDVTLIKDLPVKGAGFTAKRGTMVRGISLTDNPDHIEGRVNGQRIVLVAGYLKKA